ncbi:MAG: TRAP transporter large permease subunit [Rhodospirillales bacterium]
MEIFFVALLVLIMAFALGSGFPVAFALPGSAILTIAIAALCGYMFADNASAYFVHGGPVEWLTAGVTNFRGIYWEVERDTLIAIPLFIFMGIMLQRSRLAEDLLVTMAQMFGPVPGGLGISVIFVGALLAATTGIVGATVVAMGLISLPAMMRNKYSDSISTGTIAASGTLGQIIPPSIVLIILADQLASAVDQASTGRKELFKESTGDLLMPSAFDVTSTSAGEMFLGAFIPGMVLVGLYMAYILFVALVRPSAVPTVPYDGKYDLQFFKKVVLTLVPPLTLIFLVLGSIITGVATVNQAGAIGAAGALFMAGYRLYDGRRDAYWPAILGITSVIAIFIVLANFNMNIKLISTSSDVVGVTLGILAAIGLVIGLVWSGIRAYMIDDTLRSVMLDTAKTTSLVFIILLGAAMLTAAFRAFGGEELVKDFLHGMPGGFWAQFIIVMAVIFILGFFLDFIEIAVVVVPIVAPILLMDPSANITAVWLGVMIGLNIQTSFLTPPFGFALFYLRGVAPTVIKTISMYKGVIPFISLQLFALVIVGLTPQLVNYLPTRLSLTSDTAPPPRNPSLQFCIEDYLFEQYDERGNELKSAIASARGLDISMLPDNMQKELTASFDKAEKTFEMVATIRAAEAAEQAYAKGYKDLHTDVRALQARMRDDRKEIKTLETELRRLPKGPEYDVQREKWQAKIEKDKAEIETLTTQIPEEWIQRNKEFVALNKKHTLARNLYRRNVDQAFEPVQKLNELLGSSDAYAALEPKFMTIGEQLAAGDASSALQSVDDILVDIRALPGSYDLDKAVVEVQRALKRDPIKIEDAASAFEKAKTEYLASLEWRMAATQSLKPGLDEYANKIQDTIGLRMLSKMPEEVALDVAACRSVHRDLSLNF